MALDRSSPFLLQALAVTLALAAMVLFTLAENDGELGWLPLTGWIGLQMALVVPAAWWFRRRVVMLRDVPLVAPLLVLVVLLTLGWELGARGLGMAGLGLRGHTLEIVLMVAAKNLMLALAVVSVIVPHQRLCVLKSLFLAIFSATLTSDPAMAVGLAIYALLGVCWLVTAYWETLRARLVPESRTSLPRAWLLAVGGLVLVILLGFSGGSNQAMHALSGFLPSSGGTGDFDLFARNGVSDGDMLVAGTENIQSFAPIEDAPFLQDDQPSLYDVFDDTYDEAMKITKQERAISLDPSLFEKGCQQMARSRQASREFSTLRQPQPEKKRHVQNLDSVALMFLRGRTPLHLRLELFDLFDGKDWYPSEESEFSQPLNFQIIHERPWLGVASHPLSHELLSPVENRVLKIINLETNRIPTPLHVTGVHIDRVDRVDMFAWAQPGIIRMEREKLPELVPIHVASQTLDVRLLEGTTFTTGSTENNSRLLPQTEEVAAIRQLALSWVEGLPEGWPQVQAIQQRLRTEYIHDRDAQAPVTGDRSPLSWFLFESRRGPDYLFATAANVMLRTLGYPTRLVSGFYVNPERFDPRTRHTAILGEDVHFWCEVYVTGGLWATVEPTPGYEITQPPPTFWESCLDRVQAAGLFLWRHWLACAILLAGLGLCWYRRYPLLDQGHLLWHRWRHKSQRHQVLGALTILERRLSWLGQTRPAGVTVRGWLSRLPLQHPQLPEFLQQVDRAAFAPGWEMSSGPEIPDRMLREFNLRNLRASLSPPDTKPV